MGRLSWLPCRRRRGKESDANPPKNESLPGTEAKPSESGKQSTVEQTVPSPIPSISQDVWNEAYEGIAKDDPKLVESYMKAFIVSLQPEDAPSPNASDVSAELKNPVKRQETLESLVKTGRKKVATASKITHGAGDFANSVLEFKGLIDLAVQNIPQAALPWAGVCIGLQVSG